MLRDYSHNPRFVHNIEVVQESTTVNDIARNIPRISVASEDREVEHQSTMIEIEGTLSK